MTGGDWHADWIGTDEVGRGCLAGPVVTAAARFAPGRAPDCLNALRDSKKLSPRRREALALSLLADPAVELRITWASAAEVDRLNVLRASLQAMASAVGALAATGPVCGVYVDGDHPLPGDWPQLPVVGGDGRVPQISAASIVAKVFRDRWMECLGDCWPGYGWERNRGYGTPDHLEALARLGPSPEHRRSFAPVAQGRLDFA